MGYNLAAIAASIFLWGIMNYILNLESRGFFESTDLMEILKHENNPSFINLISKGLKDLGHWVTGYLAEPNVNLGREGPVCPYVPTAIKKNKLYLSYLKLDKRLNINHIKDELKQYGKYFEESFTDLLNSIIFLVVSEENKTLAINVAHNVQIDLKSHFMKMGLMIGQFYPDCEVMGLHNNKFLPFDSPQPFIAIRRMVPQDLLFVTDSTEHIRIYLERFNINSKQQLINLMETYNLSRNINIVRSINMIFSEAYP